MRTMYRTKPEYAEAFLRIVDETDTCGKLRPEHFIRVMKENQGCINEFSPYGIPEDGLERRNPLIVALGDSVTAGHFEPCGDLDEIIAVIESGGMPDILKNPKSPLIERVNIIRRLALESNCCLADTYLAWEKYEEAGYPAVELLANRGNHPSITGHEGFAKALMKLIVQESYYDYVLPGIVCVAAAAAAIQEGHLVKQTLMDQTNRNFAGETE